MIFNKGGNTTQWRKDSPKKIQETLDICTTYTKINLKMSPRVKHINWSYKTLKRKV